MKLSLTVLLLLLANQADARMHHKMRFTCNDVPAIAYQVSKDTAVEYARNRYAFNPAEVKYLRYCLAHPPGASHGQTYISRSQQDFEQ